MSSDAGELDRGGAGPSDAGVAGLRESSVVRDRAPSRDAHEHDVDHVALLYDDPDEQLVVAATFLRQGLERGERCVYVVDDNDRAAVLAALRAAGVDVASARDAGDLSIHSPADTYHRTGSFDRAAMVEFWEETLAAAVDDGDYAGVRAAAEMTWALEDETSADALVEYEAVLNDVYEGEEYAVCCQYNTERFPASVVRDVVRTHPYVLESDRLHDNVYYTPPEQFFEPETAQGEVDRMIGTLRSRTDAVSELERARDRFQTIVESSHDAILIADPVADEMLEANPAGCELLGHSREEILSRGPSDFHPGEMEAFCAFAEEVFEDGTGWTDELTCLPRDGDPIPAEISASRIELDGRDCLLAIVRDLSDRRRRERAQRRLYEIAADSDRTFEEKLQAVFELGCEHFDLEIGGLARVDPDRDRLEVEMTSSDHPDLVPGRVYPLSETYCREAVDAHRGPDDAVATVSDPGECYEGRLCHEQFGVRSYLGTYLEVEGDDDRTFWFVSGERPETQFSPSERTFLHLMGQWVRYGLERRQREAELEETVDDLRRSNDRLTQFAYAASHDLQEPLRMISSYLQLLERRHAPDLDPEAREYLEFAVEGADRMRAMVDDLLAYARVEQAEESLQLVDCEVIVDRVTDDLRVSIDERDAEVVVDGDLPTVTGDAEQLEQLFRNLLSNAVKYGGESPTVEVTATQHGDDWEIAVADDGIGIESDRLDRIFEVFTRLHHHDDVPGTGVGLALCEEIVDHHGGELRVDSTPGEGSTFTVVLPGRRGG